MLEFPPATVRVLLASHPVAGAHRGLETLGARELQGPSEHPGHDLAGVEDDWMATGLAEVTREGAVGALQGEFPVDDPMCPSREIRAVENVRGGDEGFDDVAAGFRVARQPSPLEAPTRRHAARIRLIVAHVLREHQPINGSPQGLQRIGRRLSRSRHELAQNESGVLAAPRLIACWQRKEAMYRHQASVKT